MRMLTLALVLLCGGVARGEWLVDGPFSRDASVGAGFSDDTPFGVQFTVTQDTVIDSIEGLLSVDEATTDVSPEDGNLSWSIFSNGDDNFPSQPLLSKNFYANETPATMRNPEWHGIHNPGWTLTPGTYWAVMQVPDGLLAPGVIRGTTNAIMGPKYPFAYYEYFEEPTPGFRWTPTVNLNFSNLAIRIAGHAVPEPSSMTLAALAMAVVALRRKAAEGRA